MMPTAFLYKYQAEQLHLYWRYYPEIGIQRTTLFSLFSQEKLGVNPRNLYPEAIRKGKWGNSFDQFLALGHLVLYDPIQAHSQRAFRVAATIAGTNDVKADLEDVFTLDYCVREDVPFSLSQRRASDISEIVIIARQALDTPEVRENGEAGFAKKQAVASWLVDVRIPSLEASSTSIRERLTSTSPVFNGPLKQLEESMFGEQLFLSPESLVKIFANAQKIEAVRRKLEVLADNAANRAEVIDDVK